MVDVDEFASRVTGGAPPLVARLAGRDLEFRSDAPVIAAADAYRIVKEHHGDSLRQVIAVVDFLDAACLNRDTLAEALRDASGAQVGALFAWLCGEYRISVLAEQAKARRKPRKADELKWGEVA